METNKKSVLVYESFYNITKFIESDSDLRILFNAMMEYGMNGIEPEFDSLHLKMAWAGYKPNMDANIKRYNKAVESGKKGGLAKAAKAEAEKIKAEAIAKAQAEKEAAEKLEKEQPVSTESENNNEISSIEDNTPQPEVQEEALEKITLEAYNNDMTTTQLVNEYKKRMKFAPIGSKLTPADFHQLTKDYFRKLDYKTVIEEVEKITDEKILLEVVNVLINKVKELEPVTV